MVTKKRKKNKGGTLLGILGVLIIICTFSAYRLFGPNTGTLSHGEFLYIHTGATYEDVKKELDTAGFISDMFSFNLFAKIFKYPTRIHPGKYKITAGMSNYTIVRMLRSNHQAPVKLVINKLRTKQDLVKMISQNLEADSASVDSLCNNNAYLGQFGLDANTAMCAIMPNTYQFYWNTNADKAFRKIEKSYAEFWTESRKQESQNLNLTPQQVIIIASILEEETNKNDEKPDIASVYLNRLNAGVPLQADPTIKFALGDFTIRRITGTYLDVVSPYNTYKNAGLPPGPICTPSVASIEAVLNAPKTSYMYFCARADFSGYHAFASTLEEHMKNAHAYQEALNSRGIH
jgi:UPF0755 protein